MSDVNGVKITSTKRTGLSASRGYKFCRRYRDRRNSQILQLCRVVQTARRARPSISQRFDHGITSRLQQLINDGFGRGLGERRLHRAHDIGDTEPFTQQGFRSVEKRAAARFADVQQADGFSNKRVEPGRNFALFARGFIQRIDECDWHNVLSLFLPRSHTKDHEEEEE